MWKWRERSRGRFGFASVETRLENFEGMPGRSERKLESRISLQPEDTAKDSLFFPARMEEVGGMGDRNERMISTASSSLSSLMPVT